MSLFPRRDPPAALPARRFLCIHKFARYISLPVSLWLAAAASLSLAIVIAAFAPRPSGYELSLYGDLSNLFLPLVGLSSLSAVGLLLLTARAHNPVGLSAGVVLIALNSLLLESLPLYLGFSANNRADALNHIGYVQDMLAAQSLPSLDFYPGLHLLQLAVQSVAGVSPAQAIMLLNLFFILLWTLAPLLLVSLLAGDHRAACLALAFSGVLWLLYYHSYALPSVLSSYLVPLFLALLVWREQHRLDPPVVSLTVTLIILSFLMILLHPATSLFTIFILMIVRCSQKLYFFYSNRASGVRLEPRRAAGSGMLSIMTVMFFSWYFYNSQFLSNIGAALRWLVDDQPRPSAIGEALGLLRIASLPLNDFFAILLNAFAAPLLLVALTVGLIAVLLLTSRSTRQPLPLAHFIHIALYLSSLALVVLIFFISTSERQPLRLLRPLIVLGLCYASWWLWEALFSPHPSPNFPPLSARRVSRLRWLLGAFLGLSLLLAQRNLYEHPRNGLPNHRVTRSEFSGMDWFVRSRLPSTQIAAALPSYVDRFAAAFMGVEGIRNFWPDWWQAEIWLPSGFYDPAWRCISAITPGHPAYLVLSDNARIASLRFPPSVRSQAHTYTLGDWDRLSDDPTASRLYDNGAFQVWLTHADAPCPP